MLEKSSTITLTKEEVKQVKAGENPERLEKDWGLSYNDSRDLVDKGQFVLVNEETK